MPGVPLRLWRLSRLVITVKREQRGLVGDHSRCLQISITRLKANVAEEEGEMNELEMRGGEADLALVGTWGRSWLQHQLRCKEGSGLKYQKRNLIIHRLN